jgi:hypothetical protein
MAIDSKRSMRFFIAATTAVLCSAALPKIATTNTPTNASLRPKAAVAGRDRQRNKYEEPVKFHGTTTRPKIIAPSSNDYRLRGFSRFKASNSFTPRFILPGNYGEERAGD